jgi:hypothetical protein
MLRPWRREQESRNAPEESREERGEGGHRSGATHAGHAGHHTLRRRNDLQFDGPWDVLRSWRGEGSGSDIQGDWRAGAGPGNRLTATSVGEGESTRQLQLGRNLRVWLSRG